MRLINLTRDNYLKVICIILVCIIPEIIAWPFKQHINILGIIFSSVITLGFIGFFYGIFQRFWFVMLLAVVNFFFLAIANHVKFSILKKPIYLADLYIMHEGLKMYAKSMELFDIFMIVAIVTILFFASFKAWNVGTREKKITKIKVIFIGSLLFIILLHAILFLNSHLVPRGVKAYRNLGVPTSLIFFHISSMHLEKIDLNKAVYVNTILSRFQQKPNINLSKEQFPDIIFVLSESFFNPDYLENISIKPDVAPFMSKLRGEKPLNLYSPVFGGNTLQAEFEALTGISILYFEESIRMDEAKNYMITRKIPFALPNYLRTIGYKTIYIHPYIKTFFMRAQMFENLGFDSAFFQEDMTDLALANEVFIADSEMYDQARKFLDKDQGRPVFIFMTSIQNHFPYNKKEHYSNNSGVERFDIFSDKLTDEQLLRLTNFSKGINLTDKATKKFIEYLKNRNRPTLIVFTPDHLPAFDDIFNKLEYFPKNSIYLTNGFIYSNYELPKLEYPNELSMFFIYPLILRLASLPTTSWHNYMLNMINECPVLYNCSPDKYADLYSITKYKLAKEL